jgi:hypothetical protein
LPTELTQPTAIETLDLADSKHLLDIAIAHAVL